MIKKTPFCPSSISSCVSVPRYCPLGSNSYWKKRQDLAVPHKLTGDHKQAQLKTLSINQGLLPELEKKFRIFHVENIYYNAWHWKSRLTWYAYLLILDSLQMNSHF